MSRHPLTAKQIVAAADCDLADGDGLILRVNGLNAAAALRFTSPVTGARREMGLGSIRRDSLAAVGESLAAARHAAEDARRMLQRKRDPIEERLVTRTRISHEHARCGVGALHLRQVRMDWRTDSDCCGAGAT